MIQLFQFVDPATLLLVLAGLALLLCGLGLAIIYRGWKLMFVERIAHTHPRFRRLAQALVAITVLAAGTLVVGIWLGSYVPK